MHHAGLLGISGDPTTPDGLVFTNRYGVEIRPPRPEPPGAGPPDTRTAEWNRPYGEQLQTRWITWS
jgi:hypothetical protein